MIPTYTVSIEQDDLPVRGNALCSDDPAYDKQVEDEILAHLDRGDIQHWCIVTVTAEIEGFRGHASIGGCSYDTEKEAKACAEEYGLHEEAFADLKKVLKGAIMTGQLADSILKQMK